MKTWVIGDIHENLARANRILKAKPKDVHAVFVGDYFDQFDQDKTKEVCEWLCQVMSSRDVTLLIGNHDLSYISAAQWSDFPAYPCPGWASHKQNVFQSHFPDASRLLEKMKLYAWVNGFLVSHAGVSNRLLAKYNSDNEGVTRLNEALEEVNECFRTRRIHTWLEPGTDRGGDNEIGGLTWCDWNFLRPIPGICQIVGHTPHWNVEMRIHSDNPMHADFDVDNLMGKIAVVEEGGEVDVISV